MSRDLTCKEFIDFLWAYLEGTVSQEARNEFERHLERCPSCVAYLKSYSVTVDLVKHAFDEEDEEGGVLLKAAPDQLLAAVIAARQSA